MPIYEYRCEDCKRRVSVFVKRIGQEAEQCPRCGGTRLVRLWSRFAMPKSEEARLEKLAEDAELAGIDEEDPKSVARFMRKMGRELGEELGDDFEEALEELESGKFEKEEDQEGAGEAGESGQEQATTSPPAKED